MQAEYILHIYMCDILLTLHIFELGQVKHIYRIHVWIYMNIGVLTGGLLPFMVNRGPITSCSSKYQYDCSINILLYVYHLLADTYSM